MPRISSPLCSGQSQEALSDLGKTLTSTPPGPATPGHNCPIRGRDFTTQRCLLPPLCGRHGAVARRAGILYSSRGRMHLRSTRPRIRAVTTHHTQGMLTWCEGEVPALFSVLAPSLLGKELFPGHDEPLNGEGGKDVWRQRKMCRT